jgi:uncharacterized protein (TIGR02996 family)
VEALAAGDFDEALRVMLAAWDQHRSPELAALIERVSAHVTQLLPPITANWIAIARDHKPSDIGRLLAAITFPVYEAQLIIAQAEELATLAPDPRVAAMLVRLVEADALRIGSGASSKVFTRATNGLGSHADPRLIASVEKISRSPYYSRTPHARKLESIAKAWCERWTTVPSEPAELAAWRAIALPSKIATISKPPRTAESLLAEIYARPDDDAPRIVYADVIGGDRAEFITLQIERAAGRGTPAAAKREAGLLRANKTAWLGALAGSVVAGRTEFARGFPSATRPSVSKQAQAEAAFTRDEWATFERIDFGGACLITEAMRGLRVALHVTETALRKLAGSPPIEELAIELDRGRELRVNQPTIALALKLPKLRSLTLACAKWRSGDALTTFVAAVAPKLAHLTVHGGDIPHSAIADVIASDAFGLAHFGWGAEGRSFAVSRDADGTLSQPRRL